MPLKPTLNELNSPENILVNTLPVIKAELPVLRTDTSKAAMYGPAG